MSAYETCPKQFYETRIAKNFKQEESAEMAWGNAVHKAMENNIKYGRALPANMEQFQWGLDLFKHKQPTTKLHAELDVGITENHTKTGFWDADCWVRGKIDVIAVAGDETSALNGDWKTGKLKPNSQQLLLSTLICLDNYPRLATVRTVFIWLAEPNKEKRLTQKLFVRQDSGDITSTDNKGKIVTQSPDELWDPFVATIDDMKHSLQHDIWPAKPSGLCKQWCPVMTCPHNGLRK
jgi:hypothetical protein